MDLEKLIIEYSEKMKAEINAHIENCPFDFHTYLLFKDVETKGFAEFAKYLVADRMNERSGLKASQIEKMNDAINDMFGYVNRIQPRYELLSDYMFNKSIYNDMQSILQEPSDEQSSSLDFFENNLREAEQKMEELKSKIDFFDWSKEEEWYSNWVSDYTNYVEKKREKECLNDLEAEM